MTHITRAGASWLGNHRVTVTWARAGPPWRASLRFRALQPDVPDADAKRTSAVSSFPPPAAQPSRACKAPGDAEAGSQVELGDGLQVVARRARLLGRPHRPGTAQAQPHPPARSPRLPSRPQTRRLTAKELGFAGSRRTPVTHQIFGHLACVRVQMSLSVLGHCVARRAG